MFEINVDGRYLSSVCLWGDLEISSVWPGGCGEASWVVSYGTAPTSLQSADLHVAVTSGGVPLFAGQLVAPDAAADRVVAQGPWLLADKYLALDASGNATTIPDVAIDQAIARGFPGKRTESFGSTAVDIDVSSGPVTVKALCDAHAEATGTRWGIEPDRRFVRRPDPTEPMWHVLGIDGGLGTALDNYASTLIGLYQNTSGGISKTAPVTDGRAESRYGRVEYAVDLTPRGPITGAKAVNILNQLLVLGRSKPQWASGLELTHGQILSRGGVPAPLDQVRAGQLVRIHSTFDDATALEGRMHLDVLLGEARLKDGVLSVTPLGVATRNYTDLVTELFERSSRR